MNRKNAKKCEEPEKEYLVHQTVIKRSDKHYAMLDDFCFRAKNLYNSALYRVRQAYFHYDGARLSYGSLDKVMKREKSADYADMPYAASAQGTLRDGVMHDWSSYWKSLKAHFENPSDFTGKPKMPGYKHKIKGRATLFLTPQQLSLENGVLSVISEKFNGFGIPVASEISFEKVKQFRIVPKNRHFVAEIVYEVKPVENKANNLRYLGVDMGIDNFVT